MLVNRVMSWSRMLTEVSPVGTSHCVLVESSSTCAVKYPPWHRSFDPNFMLSSTTWFAPNGIHTPIRIVTLLIVSGGLTERSLQYMPRAVQRRLRAFLRSDPPKALGTRFEME